ncbi:MAG: hypothetical protein QM788_05565 [Roseateles sp.]|uniref:hypothetical protein n=1 Tax=Roseateles sp. TaxID=1971397 RepID=UPI0039E95795
MFRALMLIILVGLSACGGGGDAGADKYQPTLSKATAYVGMFRLAAFSRANCINNESISWDKGFDVWNLAVGSEQTNDIGDVVWEYYDAPGEFWANAANWGGGLSPGKWKVRGFHWVDGAGDHGKNHFLSESFCTSPDYIGSHWYKADLCKETVATDCNLTEF